MGVRRRYVLNLLGDPTFKAEFYAPAVFADHPSAQGISKRAFKAAMERLLSAKRLRVETVGPLGHATFSAAVASSNMLLPLVSRLS